MLIFRTLLVFCAVVVIFGCKDESRPYIEVPRVGNIIPNFEKLPGNDGKFYDRDSILGKPLLLIFGNVNCTYCIAEEPLLKEMSQKFPAVRFVVIDYQDSMEEAKDYIGDKQDFRLWLFDDGKFLDAKYLTASTPDHFFVNSHGILKKRIVGELSKEQLEESLKLLVE